MAAELTQPFGFGPVVTKPLIFFVRNTSEEEQKQVDIRINTRFDQNREAESITTQLEVIYKVVDASPEAEDLLRLSIQSTVKTKGLFEQLPEGEELPEGVCAAVLGVALGTARGIIKAQTAGFGVNIIELPVISPLELIKGNPPQ